jgi:hypothetical protein
LCHWLFGFVQAPNKHNTGRRGTEGDLDHA